MKHIARITAVVLTLALLISLAACGSSGSPLVGKWESVEAAGTVYEFKADGTGTLSGEGYSLNFTYTEKDGAVSFTYDGATEVQSFDYTIENDVLSFVDTYGATLTYKKQ